MDIAASALSTLIFSQGFSDLYRVYFAAERDDVDYHLAIIGTDHDMESEEAFDPVYMNALFNYGREKARKCDVWLTAPPALTPPDDS